MTIVDQGEAPEHRKNELESGTGMCASMTPHRPTQRGSQELWEQRESQEGFPGEEALNWVLKESRKGESVILDRDWHEREQGDQGAGHTVSESWLLQELWAPWPLRPAVGTQSPRTNSW